MRNRAILFLRSSSFNLGSDKSFPCWLYVLYLWQLSLHVSFILSKFPFFLIRCCTCIRERKTASKNEINAEHLPHYDHSKFVIFNSTQKGLYCVEFTGNSRLKCKLKPKHARQVRSPKQMTLSIVTVAPLDPNNSNSDYSKSLLIRSNIHSPWFP